MSFEQLYPFFSPLFLLILTLFQYQARNKVALTLPEIAEKINNVRGAVTMAYPMGLPDWDLAQIALDGSFDKLKVRYNSIIAERFL